MQRRVLIIIAIAIILGIGTGFVTARLNSKFIFGIHTNAFVANTIGDSYQPENVDKAIKLAKHLGVSHLRINYEHFGIDIDQINDDFINRVIESGLTPVLILESPYPLHLFFDKENYQTGYDLGKRVASRYKNQIKYIQIANEVSGMVIKASHPGNKFSDYDPNKYRVMRDWLRGLAEGVKAGNRKVQRIVSSNWVATAVIDQLIADDVPFEIVGWNWFSDMGDDPTSKQLDDGTILDIPGHFAQTGKKFWFVEFNWSARLNQNGHLEQADYFKRFWANIKDSPHVHGLFGFTLVDFAPFQPQDNRDWGFVTLVSDRPGHFTPGDPKPVFYEFQKIIREGK